MAETQEKTEVKAEVKAEVKVEAKEEGAKKEAMSTEEIVDKFYDPEAEVMGNWHKTVSV